MVNRISYVLIAVVILGVSLSYKALPDPLYTHTSLMQLIEKNVQLQWGRENFLLFYMALFVITNLFIYLLLPMLVSKYPKGLIWINRSYWFKDEDRQRQLITAAKSVIAYAGLYANFIFLFTYWFVYLTNIGIADYFHIIFIIAITAGTVWFLYYTFSTLKPGTETR